MLNIEKYYIEVKTITYQDQVIPSAVIYDQKLYLISAVISVRQNVVFSEGGIGAEYTITINKKETRIFQDKYLLKWHVYKDKPNKKAGQIDNVEERHFFG
ncbi:MAG: hypothetical protein ACOH15_04280 [Acetobacterium sp.]